MTDVYFTVLERIEFCGSHTLNGNQTKWHEGELARQANKQRKTTQEEASREKRKHCTEQHIHTQFLGTFIYIYTFQHISTIRIMEPKGSSFAPTHTYTIGPIGTVNPTQDESVSLDI